MQELISLYATQPYSAMFPRHIHHRSGYSPGGRASKNYLPGRRVNNLLLARQRK